MFFWQPLHFVTHTLTNRIPLMPYTPSLGSNGPYSSVLGIHFTTRVALTTVRRGHNNWAPKFRVDTDGETENTTTLSTARKDIYIYIYKERKKERRFLLLLLLLLLLRVNSDRWKYEINNRHKTSQKICIYHIIIWTQKNKI